MTPTLLEGLPAKARDEALAAFRTYEHGRGEVLVVEGDVDRGMLVLLDGELVVTREGSELARLNPGDAASEETLFGTTDRRSATVTTASPCRRMTLGEDGIAALRRQDNLLVAELEVRVLRVLAARLHEMNRRITEHAVRQPRTPPPEAAELEGPLGAAPTTAPPRPVDVLQRAAGFAGRSVEDLEALATRMELVAAPCDAVLIQQGRRAESAYLVCSGRIGVTTQLPDGSEERVAVLGEGQLFGHVALADENARSATCRAITPAYLMRLSAGTFHALEREPSPAGRVLRPALIEAISGQLRLANEHFVALQASRPRTLAAWGG